MNVGSGALGRARPTGATERDLGPGVVRVPVTSSAISSLGAMADPGYVDQFTLARGIAGASPEQWARAMFEEVVGRRAQFVWRGLLGLRLKASPDRIAGWTIAGRGSDFIRLEASSWFLTAQLVVQADDEHMSLVTLIRYDRRLARRIWLPLSRIHRRVAPGLLRGAYRVAPR